MKRIVWVLLSSIFTLSTAHALTLSSLRTQLRKEGGTWQADRTKVSDLSVEDQKRLLGAQIADPEDFFFVPQMRPQAAAPTAWDWRNQNGVNYASPILDQGRCGSCVAFAAIAQLETQLNITRGTPSSPWAFSPQHLFSCGGGGCETGWTPFGALNFLQSTGVPDEACFPYESGSTGTDAACSRSCADASSRSTKIIRSHMAAFFFASVETVKSSVRRGPVLATMMVYEDFMFYKGGVYRYTGGAQLGGHAVVIEGWNDAEKSWLVRNNWGPDWGEKGYFRVAWGDKSGVGNSAWGIEVPVADGFVNFQGLRDRAVLSGKAQALNLESSFADTQRIRWQLLDSGKTVRKESDLTRSGSLTVDTTDLADGKYTLVAIAERASGPVRGQPREVYVLNGALTGTATLKSHTSGQTVAGKQILKFGLTSAPIPFTELVFRAVNVATGEVVERRTPHVAAEIHLSLETKKFANGDWDLTLDALAGGQKIVSPAVRLTFKN